MITVIRALVGALAGFLLVYFVFTGLLLILGLFMG